MSGVHPLLRYTAAQSGWLLETLEQLVRAESPSTSKSAVDRCGGILASLLASIGGAVERIPHAERGDSIRAVFEGVGPQVMVLGHVDTVWDVGQLTRMPYHEADGRVYGPGIFDMKAGIVVAGLAARALRELALPTPRVVMLFTTDEEIGSTASRALIEDEARRSGAVLVLEPPLPGGGAKTSRKGVGVFELVAHGVSAHAGIAPAQGANAVHEIAHQIVAMQSLQALGRGVSVNATIVTGGARSNVIPDMARAVVDVRVPAMADARGIEAAMRALTPRLAGTRLELSGGIDRPPLERSPQGVALFEQARGCAGELGKALGEGATGGGSDGNFTAALGVPTLDGLGPEGDGAHALHEHVISADLPWRAAFLARLLSSLADRSAFEGR